MVSKWFQNGFKMVSKWFQNGFKIILNIIAQHESLLILFHIYFCKI